jgi:hypothetical protein
MRADAEAEVRRLASAVRRAADAVRANRHLLAAPAGSTTAATTATAGGGNGERGAEDLMRLWALASSDPDDPDDTEDASERQMRQTWQARARAEHSRLATALEAWGRASADVRDRKRRLEDAKHTREALERAQRHMWARQAWTDGRGDSLSLEEQEEQKELERVLHQIDAQALDAKALEAQRLAVQLQMRRELRDIVAATHRATAELEALHAVTATLETS